MKTNRGSGSIAPPFMISAIDKVNDKLHSLVALSPPPPRYPLARRLGGLESGRCGKESLSLLLGVELRPSNP
jgi:hypothetical protein